MMPNLLVIALDEHNPSFLLILTASIYKLCNFFFCQQWLALRAESLQCDSASGWKSNLAMVQAFVQQLRITTQLWVLLSSSLSLTGLYDHSQPCAMAMFPYHRHSQAGTELQPREQSSHLSTEAHHLTGIKADKESPVS